MILFRPASLHLRPFLFLSFLTVVLAATELRAQTLYPSVALRRNPTLALEAWPGDFNGDGITDLVATARTSPALVVVPGRGDGTFGTPVTRAVAGGGKVIQVADFNGDRRPDVILSREFPDPGVFILAGTGALRLAAPQRVDPQPASFALTGDFSGDGRRDLLLAGGEIRIHPGNGDLTFDAPARVPFDFIINGGISGDFDGDTDRDFAVVDETFMLTIYRNSGGLLFAAASPYRFSSMPTDVTAGDLDRDGRLDLVVSTSVFENQQWGAGDVQVLRGRGDGTFTAPVAYEVGKGAFQVVVGDFTHDGWLDIATANRSFIEWPGCGISPQGSDSVTIVPSVGSGRFGTPATFALANQSMVDSPEQYRNNIRSLNTSDLDRDRFPDLIVSEGVVLLSRVPRANRIPVANAGPDTRQLNDPVVQLVGLASDPDAHLLEFVWTGSDGTNTGVGPLRPTRFCVDLQAPGTYTYTLTVDDGLGGRDDDSKVVIFESTQIPPTVDLIRPTAGEVVPAGVPYTIRWTADDDFGIARIEVRAFVGGREAFIIPECHNLPATATECTWRNPSPTETASVEIRVIDIHGNEGADVSGMFFIRGTQPANSLPPGWTNRDIGAVAAAGGASLANGRFTIRGSGADIWGTADEFHYAYRVKNLWFGGSFEITTRVDSVQNLHRWVKAGLMIRESTAPGARHVSIFATPRTERGIAFQRRPTTGGASIHTAGAALAPPVWLRLVRSNDIVRSYYRKRITDPWTFVGEQSIAGYPETVLVGFAVSSHVDGRLASATFSQVVVEDTPSWSAVHVGTSQGTSTFDGTLFSVEGSGSIRGTSDSFALVGPNFFSANMTFTARVLSVENTNASAKAGVMIRHTLDPGSPFAMVFVTAAGRVGMQWRSTPGGSVVTSTLRTAAAPVWLRMDRFFNTYRGFFSTDGVTFTPVGSVDVFGDVSHNGLAVASHSTARATARFDDVRLVIR